MIWHTMTSHSAHHFLIWAVREWQLTPVCPESWPLLNQHISSIKASMENGHVMIRGSVSLFLSCFLMTELNHFAFVTREVWMLLWATSQKVYKFGWSRGKLIFLLPCCGLSASWHKVMEPASVLFINLSLNKQTCRKLHCCGSYQPSVIITITLMNPALPFTWHPISNSAHSHSTPVRLLGIHVRVGAPTFTITLCYSYNLLYIHQFTLCIVHTPNKHCILVIFFSFKYNLVSQY